MKQETKLSLSIGVAGTIGFLLIWFAMLMRGYDYFIAWKGIIITFIFVSWGIACLHYMTNNTTKETKKTTAKERKFEEDLILMGGGAGGAA